MNKSIWVITVCTIAIIGCFYYWVVKYSPKIETPEDKILEEMELLSNKVDSIKRANDSIKVIIDTTEVEI